MSLFKHTAAALAAFAVLATPTTAQAGDSDAEALRKLDIMLMVTSLRCRRTADNFQADYQRFSSNNLTALNAAARTLQAGMVKKAGAAGAKRALDKISVGMANEYGNGHPWLGCGELKQVTRELATSKNSAQLATAADELLSSRPRGQWAMAAAR
jgi:hypothetical protein